MRKRLLILSLMVFITVSILSVNETTYALYKDNDKVQNNFDAADIKINIDEKKDDENEFKNIERWNGKEENKIVRIENLSTGDAFIRVAIGLRWINEDGTPFAGDTSIVTVNFSQNDKWFKDEKSKYYYYKEIIDKDAFTEPIIESVSASLDKLDGREREKYYNKKLIVDVKAEAVQANNGIYKNVWKDISVDASDMLSSIE